MPWNLKTILDEAVNSKNKLALSNHIKIQNNQIIDTKWQIKIKITEDIYLYDSLNNKVNKINITQLKSIIKSKKSEIRHWIQLVENKQLKSLVLYLSPRLEYLFY